MAEPFVASKRGSPNPADYENQNQPAVCTDGDRVVRRCLSFSSERRSDSLEEPTVTQPNLSLESDTGCSNPPLLFPEERVSTEAPYACLRAEDDDDLTQQQKENVNEDKENIHMHSRSTTQVDQCEDCTCSEAPPISNSKQHAEQEERDAEVVKRAKEEGCVKVVFPGTVTQDGCYRFVSEIFKCILYQRQQLPMTYDQLVYSQKNYHASVQDKDAVKRSHVHSRKSDHKCQQTLQDLEEVLHQLEGLFSLSRVPRVLLLMGDSPVLPKELYEINMSDVVLAGGDQSLRVSSCLRQLFRTLFVADLLSDTKPVRLMPTTVLALAHRNCGVGWFRPKLQFKVPTRVKNQQITLQSDPDICANLKVEEICWEDYIWFQAPLTIKGFSN